MKFLDTIELVLEAGNGGNGCMSFRRERFMPFGGPDGGNGGNGGSIILRATENLQTLADFQGKRHFKADSGAHGEGSNRNGRYAADHVILVPCGTLVYDASTGEGLADLVEPGDQFLAVKGGRGGRGNRVFASSANKVPRFSEKGKDGERLRVKLELKLIADIGLVGLPNAGKSSLLAAISNAQPKIAAYPFTTLSPNLGVLSMEEETLVLADIPGLIEGASDNKGLGLAFLRHIERTRLLLHLVDVASGDINTVLSDWSIVREEMHRYDPELTNRPVFVLANKIDMLTPQERAPFIEELRTFFFNKGHEFYAISAFTGENTDILVEKLMDFSSRHPRPKGFTRLFAIQNEVNLSQALPQRRRRLKVEIIIQSDGVFRVLHPALEEAAIRFDFSQEGNQIRFRRLLYKNNVESLLIAAGAEEGDTICIGKTEFVFMPDRFSPDEPFDDLDLDNDSGSAEE